MILLFVSLIIGAVGGIFVRREHHRKRIGKVTQLLGSALLFAMGLGLGADTEIWKSIGTIGWSSAIIALFSVTGSIAVASLYDRFHPKKGV